VIRILLVDDHPVVREGFAAILSAEHDLVVVGEAATGEEAIREAARSDPDVVVLDVRLPGINGIETCAALLAKHPKVKVILLTSFPSEGAISEAIAAGAKGFLVKTTDRTVLRQAIRTVIRGETFFDPQVACKLVDLATRGRRVKGPHDLTLMEMRVLEHLPRGLTNSEIGVALGVSAQTVKSHLAHAMRKLNARDRTQAAALAIREGLA
jgi:DNA-binding NarL/FixJ family response regulator